MRARLTTFAVLAAVLIGGTGCTASHGDTAASAAPTVSTAAPSTAPVPAGRSEARVLARLPVGSATGKAVVDYSQVGEVRAPFRGTCSHSGAATRIDGTADTARIRIDVAPTGARLALTDVGLSATSDLAAGTYVVSGRHLSLATHLTHQGETIGSVALDIDC